MCGNFSTAELAGIAERTPPTWVGDTPCLWQSLPGGRAGPEVTLGALGPAIPHWLDLQDRGFPWQLPAAFLAPDPEGH